MANIFDDMDDIGGGSDTTMDLVQPQRQRPTQQRKSQSPTSEEAADDFVSDMEEDVPPELKAVEERLELAHYYSLLLKHNVFGDDDSEPALKVLGEVRGFIRQRLAVLVGLQVEPAVAATKQVFSDDEVAALKMVAAKVLKKPEIVKVPEVKQLSVQPAPKPAPALAPVATKRPVGRPRKIRLGRDVLSQAPAANPAKNPAKVAAKPPQEPGAEIAIGEIHEVNGRRYKRVEHPVSGEPFDMDVSGQVVSAQAIPQPTSKEAIENMYAAAAQREQSSLGNIVDAKTLASVNLILKQAEERGELEQ